MSAPETVLGLPVSGDDEAFENGIVSDVVLVVSLVDADGTPQLALLASPLPTWQAIGMVTVLLDRLRRGAQEDDDG